MQGRCSVPDDLVYLAAGARPLRADAPSGPSSTTPCARSTTRSPRSSASRTGSPRPRGGHGRRVRPGPLLGGPPRRVGRRPAGRGHRGRARRRGPGAQSSGRHALRRAAHEARPRCGPRPSPGVPAARRAHQPPRRRGPRPARTLPGRDARRRRGGQPRPDVPRPGRHRARRPRRGRPGHRRAGRTPLRRQLHRLPRPPGEQQAALGGDVGARSRRRSTGCGRRPTVDRARSPPSGGPPTTTSSSTRSRGRTSSGRGPGGCTTPSAGSRPPSGRPCPSLRRRCASAAR